MKLSNKFYWEDYVNSWEINYYNNLTEEETKSLKEKLGMSYLGIYYKSGDEWCSRSSGMLFNITNSSYYSKLKEHLNKEFNIFIRKQKLKKINENSN